MEKQQQIIRCRLRQKIAKRKEITIDEIIEEGHLARSLADGDTHAATDRVGTTGAQEQFEGRTA